MDVYRGRLCASLESGTCETGNSATRRELYSPATPEIRLGPSPEHCHASSQSVTSVISVTLQAMGVLRVYHFPT